MSTPPKVRRPEPSRLEVVLSLFGFAFLFGVVTFIGSLMMGPPSASETAELEGYAATDGREIYDDSFEEPPACVRRYLRFEDVYGREFVGPPDPYTAQFLIRTRTKP